MTTRCNLVVVFTLVVLSGCGEQTKAPQPGDNPRDFFPCKVGATWIYEIEVIGKDPPLKYEEGSWPIGEGKAVRYVNAESFSTRKAQIGAMVRRSTHSRCP